MLNIKILGPGCANCRRVEAVAKNAVAALGVEAHIEKVTDYVEIMKYNVLATPGLVINQKLVAAGRIPHQSEVNTWIAGALTMASGLPYAHIPSPSS